MAPVAVTGATGFVGGALVRRLREAGYPVRVLVRDRRRGAQLAALGCHLVPGDLADADALRQLVDGTDGVLHCAAAVRGRSAADFESPNVDGTAALLRAIADCGTPRLLHLSSLAAREPSLSWYSASKRRAERLLVEGAPPTLAWCLLRPPAIYGPGDRELLGLWRLARRGWLLVPGNRRSRLSFLHVDDLVAALLRLLDPALPLAGEHFDIADGRSGGYGWDELAALTGRVWQRRVRPLPLPAPALRGLATGNLALARLTRGRPMLTPGKARELMHRDWTCGHAALSHHCGWQPRTALAAGLAALDLDSGGRPAATAA